MKQQFAFCQSDYDLRFSAGGICATLAARWLKEMRTNKSSGPAARKSVMEELAESGGPLVQKTYAKAWDSASEVEANNKFILRNAGDAAVTETKLCSTGLPSGTELRDYVKTKRRQGMHFNFGGRNSSGSWGHAIGFWRSGQDTWHSSGHIYTFDPNFGEYKGDKGEFATWLPKFLNDNYRSATMTIDWSYILLTDAAELVVAAPKFGVRVM